MHRFVFSKSFLPKLLSFVTVFVLVFTSSVILSFAEGETEFVSEPGSILIGVITKGEGKVTGGGMFQKGDTVTLNAVTDGKHGFIAWYGPDKTVLSTETTYSFTAEENCFISAEFESKTPEEKEDDIKAQKTSSEAKRQLVWVACIFAVTAAVVFLVVIVEKKRSKNDK